MKSIRLPFSIAVCCVAASASANILYLTNGIGGDFAFAEEANQVQFLRDQGFTIDVQFYEGAGSGSAFSGTLSAGQINTLNTYDLIYKSRDLSSADYNAFGADWNNVTAPIINSSPFMVRSDRMGWLSVSSANNEATAFSFTANTSPILNGDGFNLLTGITLDGSNQFPILSSVDTERVSSGSGTSTGEVMSVSGRTAVAIFAAGVALPGGGGTPSGDRMFLAWTNFSTAGGFAAEWADITPQGQQLLTNSFNYMAVPEPSVYAAFLGAGALCLVLWRRRR